MAKTLAELTKLPRKGVSVGLHYQDSEVQKKRFEATLAAAKKEFSEMQEKMKDKQRYLAQLRIEIEEKIKREDELGINQYFNRPF